jgi:phosphoadenosine phosphosulfate reductase
MALWRDGGFTENMWATLAEGEPAPLTGAIIVPAPRWRAEREALSQRAAPVGVAIAAGKDAVAQLAEAADRPLIVLTFAKFADGRAFSLAQLLRERHGFKGELRAGGDVLLDEIPLMLRCGFDSFEIVNEPTLRALHRGPLPGGSLYYQPSLAPHEAPAGTRPWLRRRADA